MSDDLKAAHSKVNPHKQSRPPTVQAPAAGRLALEPSVALTGTSVKSLIGYHLSGSGAQTDGAMSGPGGQHGSVAAVQQARTHPLGTTLQVQTRQTLRISPEQHTGASRRRSSQHTLVPAGCEVCGQHEWAPGTEALIPLRAAQCRAMHCKPACLQYHSSGSVPGRWSAPMACLVSSASGKAVVPPRLGLARSAGRQGDATQVQESVDTVGGCPAPAHVSTYHSSGSEPWRTSQQKQSDLHTMKVAVRSPQVGPPLPGPQAGPPARLRKSRLCCSATCGAKQSHQAKVEHVRFHNLCNKTITACCSPHSSTQLNQNNQPINHNSQPILHCTAHVAPGLQVRAAVHDVVIVCIILASREGGRGAEVRRRRGTSRRMMAGASTAAAGHRRRTHILARPGPPSGQSGS